MKQMFSRQLGVIEQRWILSLLGVVFLVVLVYYVAPLISAKNSTLVTLFSAVGLMGVWLTFWLVSLWRAHREEAAILNSLQSMAAQNTQEAVDEELGLLQERIAEAMSELKRSRFGGKDGGETHYLYRMPWYVLIGPPASGKTTLLKNSSLQTVLSKKFGRESISGIGGTRHCDWWFAEQAVLLDTAGRYTTQDSHKDKDSKAWLGFLDLLKKHRERRPINGVMIAISLDELLSDNMLQRAKEVRWRLQELYEQFSLNLPVYLIFTKTDLLAGFSEFFADQGKEARRQVWGTTFTDKNKAIEAPLAQFLQELNLLEERLKGQLLYKLEGEKNVERRRKIYAFPEQFAEIKAIAYQFAHEVFAESPYQHKVLFRGAYFTSAEQIGSPINKLLSNLARTFGFKQTPAIENRNKGKSYFIDDLLQKVIFPEAELAGENLVYERKKRFLKSAMAASIVFVTLLGIGLWGVGYQKNNTDIQFVKTQAEGLQQLMHNDDNSDDSIMPSLKILNQAAHLSGQQNAHSILATFGLSQHDKLQSQIDNVYQQTLHARLLPYVLQTLEQGLQRQIEKTDNGKALLHYLKGYLLLASKHTKHYVANQTFLQALVLRDWKIHYKNELTPEQLKELTAHLNHFIQMKPVLARVGLTQDGKLIEDARNVLRKHYKSALINEQWVLGKQ